MSIDWSFTLSASVQMSMFAFYAGFGFVGGRFLIRRRVCVQSNHSVFRLGALIHVAVFAATSLVLFTFDEGWNDFAFLNKSRSIEMFVAAAMAASWCGLMGAIGQARHSVLGYPESSASRLFSIAAMNLGGSVKDNSIVLSSPRGTVRMVHGVHRQVPWFEAKSREGRAMAAEFAGAVERATTALPRPVETGVGWWMIFGGIFGVAMQVLGVWTLYKG